MTTRKKTSRGKGASTASTAATSVNSGRSPIKPHHHPHPPHNHQQQQLRTSPRRQKKNASTTSNATNDDNDDGTQMEGVAGGGGGKHNRNESKQKHPSKEQHGGGDGYDKQLAVFVRETIKIGVPKLVKDFHEARATAPKNMPKTAFEKNHDKNRYKDVICMDETRVVLTWPPENPNDYIHANWVNVRGEKRYICTQGPTSKTVEDFWRLVFQEKCKGIVMLTEVMELGKKK
uniref:Tyrosine-protein phosphatase domain-containing protein n=1 Tax=Panagrolaimus sp. ES5 TaxID=591445 RepID=A0AC34FZG4_9BILA